MDPIIKLCDFGSAKQLSDKGMNTPYVVSRYYRAPELILAIRNYNCKIDIWSAGCILAELILMRPIFVGDSEGETMFKIFEILGSPNDTIIEFYKKYIQFSPEVFKQFPQYQPKGVQPIRNLFTNSLFNDKDNLVDLLTKMFDYNFETRISAQEALQHPFFNEIKYN